MPTSPTQWPVRAIWTWPLATGAVTAGELFARRSAFDPVALITAIASGFAMGTWLAVVTTLLAVMARRRGWSMPARLRLGPGATAVLACAAVCSVVVVAIGWWLLDVGLALVHERPLDYPQVGTQLGRAVVLLGAPIGVALLVIAVAPLTRWLAVAQRARIAIGVFGAIGVFAAAMHLGSGAFVVYLGSAAATATLVLAAIIAAVALPATRAGRGGALLGATAILIAIGGVLGLQHPGARALLLHHGRLTPTLVALGLGFADGDGDGDYPPWLGGGDCDDDDPRISIATPEIPGNGLDDNCWAGDRPATAEPAAPPVVAGPRPMIVLVTIDTVRPDRLELYGSTRATMPALQALAARGLVFERAYAPANHTFFAMTALLAGQSTERMLVPAPEPTAQPGVRYTRWLPQRLRELGYHVVAIAPPLVVDGKIAPQELRVDEIDLGPFDSGEKNRGTTSRQLADAAIAKIDHWSGTEPLALWLHFMDPHAVHESPVRFAVNDVLDAYDNELSWVDLHLSRVLQAVHRRVGDDAIIVVTADHGESFGEDGDWGHGFSLHEREIRVPLVIVGNGVPIGRPTAPTSTLAIAPTLLELLGQAGDPALTVTSVLAGEPDPVIAANPAWLWNELRMEVARIEGTHKLVWSRTTNTVELFDLEGDPAERQNLVGADPQRRDQMLDGLRDALEHGQ